MYVMDTPEPRFFLPKMLFDKVKLAGIISYILSLGIHPNHIAISRTGTEKCFLNKICFRATNMFSFQALFANNPFWCLNLKHVFGYRFLVTNRNVFEGHENMPMVYV